MKKKILAIALIACMVLGLLPGLPMQTVFAVDLVHTVAAWDDPRLGSGMPGVTSGDIIALPETAAAGTTLSVPAGITALTVQGHATYTNFNIVLDMGHPGLTLTIEDLSMGESAGIDLSDSSASSLVLVGSNTIASRIVVPEGMTLSISGSGSLVAGAGIGGGHDGSENGGTVTIFGGTITAQGQNGAAGIGGGYGPARGADVVIWDGNITAAGDDGGAGIGCGDGTGNPGTVTIHGGTIIANGGTGGAGIGGGDGHGVGGSVTINGGDITTTGGDNGSGDRGGAGIGNGASSGAYGVTINGGTIRSYGGANAAGIGCGSSSTAVDMAITNGTITAVGGSGTGEIDDSPFSSGGAGIGGGSRSGNGSCSISGGTVTAQGGDSSAGIGSGFKSGSMALTMSGGSITATGGESGAGIGSGIWGGGVDLAVSGGRITANGGTNAQDIGASNLVVGGLHGASGSLTVTGWTLITADDMVSTSGSNGPYTLNLYTGPGVPAGVRAVTVTADDSSFSFTQNTSADGTLGGIYLVSDIDVFISVAECDVKAASDTIYGPSVAFNSGSSMEDIYIREIAAPTVTTGDVSSLTASGASLSGNVTDDGGTTVTERGFVYGAAVEPAIGGTDVTRVTATGTDTSSFLATLSGLAAGTTYHVRAYAINSEGTGYGTDVSFRTHSTPEVTTGIAEHGLHHGLEWNQMYLYGNVTSSGTSEVTERGIVYTTVFESSGADNLISGGTNVNNVTASAGGTGEYRVQVNNITSNTTYYYRAYATNSAGTIYGAIRLIQFLGGIHIYVQTEDGGEVVIGTEAAWSETPTNARGALYWNGSAWVSSSDAMHMYFYDAATGQRLRNYTDVAIPVTAGTQDQNGISFNAEEYNYQTAAADGSGTYQYTGMKYTLTQADGKKILLLSRGLGRGTDISYLEVFIENPSSGTLAIRDGSVLYNHTGTAADTADLNNPSTSVMGLLRTADVYWLDREGGSDMGGVTYSPHTAALSATQVAAAHPAITNQVVRFDLLLLSAESELYRYILSPKLTSERFIPTTTAPTVITNAVSSVTASGVTLNGGITADGGATVTARGFAYGISPNPTTADSTVQAGSGTGEFCYTLSGLTASTTYHVRAYAVNITGTSYGEDRTFATQSGGDDGNSGGETGNTGSSSNSETVTPLYTADVLEGGVKTDTLAVTVSGSTGTASLGAAKAAALFDAGNASVVMPSIPGVSAYTLELPASALDEGQKGGALTLSTGFGSVTIPDNMLGSLAGTDGKTAGITVARGDTSGLTDAEKAAVGSHPLIQLTLTLGGTKTEWNNPAAPVTVTIPYTPTAAELENPECIIIWYLDGSGNLVCVPNGHYDAATGTVTFKTTHFSFFAGGYKKVTFNDVAENAWYGTAVDFIAARGITTGTGNGNFSPDATLTRGQFIVMLMRSYGISPDAAPTDNFSDAGSTYYTNYLAAAKRLGIAKGVGNNLFAPEQPITRQEMFTLLYNALKVIGQLPQGNGRLLTDFTDADRIAPWAQEAMKRLVEAMMINGSGNKLSPEDTATRAELAQLLYNLLMR